MDLHSIVESLFADLRPLDPNDRPDAAEITKVVRSYARRIGLTASNAECAVSWALRSPEALGQLAAIRTGKHWANVLHDRQAPRFPRHPSAA